MAVGKVSDTDFESEVLKAAGPVVVSWVRSDRMQATSTRNGSRSCSAMSASAVRFQRGRVRRSRRMTPAMSTACP